VSRRYELSLAGVLILLRIARISLVPLRARKTGRHVGE